MHFAVAMLCFEICYALQYLWLDKVCIQQEKLSEGLRSLPIFLAACKQMLVLAGDTYVSRLWCAW